VQISLLSNEDLPLLIQPKTDKSLGYFFDWIDDNLNILYENLYIHGAILFRGFAVNNAIEFYNFLKALKIDLLTYIGGDSPRKKVYNNIYTSTSFPSSHSISLHNEKSYSNNYPNLIFFFCEVPSEQGGETPLIDGRKLYKLLDREVINKFQNKKIKYVMNLSNTQGIGKSWQECFETQRVDIVSKYLKEIGATYEWKDNGGLRVEEIVNPIIKHPINEEYVFFSQADQWHPSNLDAETLGAVEPLLSKEDLYHNCYYGDNSFIDLKDLNHIRETVKQNCIAFPWMKGDILMLDNILTLHGRTPFTGNRRILTAMA